MDLWMQVGPGNAGPSLARQHHHSVQFMCRLFAAHAEDVFNRAFWHGVTGLQNVCVGQQCACLAERAVPCNHHVGLHCSQRLFAEDCVTVQCGTDDQMQCEQIASTFTAGWELVTFWPNAPAGLSSQNSIDSTCPMCILCCAFASLLTGHIRLAACMTLAHLCHRTVKACMSMGMQKHALLMHMAKGVDAMAPKLQVGQS